LDKLDELSGGNFFTKYKRLLLWYFEAELKTHVSHYIDTLEVSI
jgi:hypothetical protein